MRLGLLFLLFAAGFVAIGVSHIVDWHRHGARYDLLMGGAFIVLSPVWIVHWLRERRRTGS